MKWRIEINDGDEIPRHFGVAYYVAHCARGVCYPIPVNHVVSAWRVVSRWLMLPPWRGFEYKLHALERSAMTATRAERVKRKGFEDALRFIAVMPELDLRARFGEIEARSNRYTTGDEDIATVMRALASYAVRWGWPTERNHT